MVSWSTHTSKAPPASGMVGVYYTNHSAWYTWVRYVDIDDRYYSGVISSNPHGQFIRVFTLVPEAHRMTLPIFAVYNGCRHRIIQSGRDVVTLLLVAEMNSNFISDCFGFLPLGHGVISTDTMPQKGYFWLQQNKAGISVVFFFCQMQASRTGGWVAGGKGGDKQGHHIE